MFVTVMQQLEEDSRNGFISVLYSPLNAEFMYEVDVLTFVHDAPCLDNHYMDDHLLLLVMYDDKFIIN